MGLSQGAVTPPRFKKPTGFGWFFFVCTRGSIPLIMEWTPLPDDSASALPRAETGNFEPKAATSVRTTKWNRTVLCLVPGQVHTIEVRAKAAQALVRELTVGA